MLTETEMRDFFNRVVDQVNQLTGTAAQVEGLTQQVNALTQRIAELESQNGQLYAKLAEVDSDLAKARDEAHSHEAAAVAANEHVNSLRETIVQADHRVADLSTSLKNEEDSHRITKADLEDARRAVAEWEANYNKTKDELYITTTSRNEWQSRADEYVREISELKAKLDKIQAALSPASIDLHVVA